MRLTDLISRIESGVYNENGCYDENFREDLYEVFENKFPLENECAPDKFDTALNNAYTHVIYGAGHKSVLDLFMKFIGV